MMCCWSDFGLYHMVYTHEWVGEEQFNMFLIYHLLGHDHLPLLRLIWLDSPASKSYSATNRLGSSVSSKVSKRFSRDIHLSPSRPSGAPGSGRLCSRASVGKPAITIISSITQVDLSIFSCQLFLVCQQNHNMHRKQDTQAYDMYLAVLPTFILQYHNECCMWTLLFNAVLSSTGGWNPQSLCKLH